jgi:hypothetical protein
LSCVVILIGECFILIRRRSFRKNAIKTKGTIVKLSQREKNYYPTVEFTTVDGKFFRVVFQVGTNPPIGLEGNIITIYYDSHQPEKTSLPMGFAGYFIFAVFTFLALFS